MEIRDLQEQISQLAERTIDNFSKEVQTLINEFNTTSSDLSASLTDAEEPGDELQSDPGQNLTVTSEHPIGFHGTTTLIILFVLLGIVLAAAVGTRIWNRWRKAKSKEEDRRQVYLYSWY